MIIAYSLNITDNDSYCMAPALSYLKYYQNRIFVLFVVIKNP